MRWLVLALLLAAGPLETAQQKLAAIVSGHVPGGGPVLLSAAELDAVARSEAADYGKGSIRQTHLNLWAGHAGISARVDLARLAQARGNALHPLLERMLSGERQIRAVLRLETVHGQALVDLESLEVDGRVLEGRALDLLIQQFVNAEFPDARLDRWFAMEYGIDTIELSRGLATVTLRRR